ncbi:ATP-binding cassette domain-containing protein, partial [Natronococcus sp.]|uniref:ATP-binding cassette domain-containing protein n=1 Tax=Natronococcus sp. TaxID=35747 RepID=UPI003A4E5C45
MAIGLEARNLTKRFGQGAEGVTAVNDVSFEIQEGELFSLLGESGCGKTTFLRALNRMHDYSPGARITGSVYLGDTDIYANGMNPVELRIR